MKRRNIAFIIVLLMISFFSFELFYKQNKKIEISNYSIDDILKSESYSYLPDSSKRFIKEKYSETGEILLTEKNKEDNYPYLNPEYVSYLELSEEEKSNYEVVPEETITNVIYSNSQISSLQETSFSSSYDLRNEDRITTELKNQSSLGICIAFGLMGAMESSIKTLLNTSVIFNERQIDYASSYPVASTSSYVNDSDNGKALISEKYNPYAFKGIGSGMDYNNLYTLILAGQIPTKREGSTWGTYFTANNTLNLNSVFDYSNVSYSITDLQELPGFLSGTPSDEYKNAIKNAIVSFGSVAMATKAPQIDCYSKNSSGDIIINTNYCIDAKNKAATHAMQIIGWNDNYNTSYCADSSHNSTESNNTKTKCESGGGKWVTTNGAWILKNSWGTGSSYPYLTYDSIVSTPVVVTGVKAKDWNNNYNSKLSGSEILTQNKVSEISFSRQHFSNEKVKRISFVSKKSNSNYIIYLNTDSNCTNSCYKKVGEITSDDRIYSGIFSIDVDSELIAKNSDSISVKIVATDSKNVAFKIDENKISIFTNVLNKNESEVPISVKHVYNQINTGSSTLDNKYYISNLKFDTGKKINIKVKNSSGTDYSNKLDISGNYVINGQSVITIKEKEYIPEGNYTTYFYDGDEEIANSTYNVLSAYGNGTEENPFKIYTEEDFISFVQNGAIKEDGYYFSLENDLDFSKLTKPDDISELDSSGLYACYLIDNDSILSGVFDGNNHSIAGLNICGYKSIFGNAEDLTIKNLAIININAKITGTDSYGLLLNKVTGDITVDNVKVSGSINYKTETSLKGTLIGTNDGSGTITISNVQIIENFESEDIFSNSNAFIKVAGKSHITNSYALLNIKSKNFNGTKLIVKYDNNEIEKDISEVSNLNLNTIDSSYWSNPGVYTKISTLKKHKKYVDSFEFVENNVSITSKSMTVGETRKIDINVLLTEDGEELEEKNEEFVLDKIYFYSSNTNHATVTQDGYVTKLSNEPVYIYAISSDGTYIDKLELKSKDEITITPKTYVYDGNIKEGLATSTSGNLVNLKYYSDNKCTVEAQPKNVGVYYATGTTSLGGVLSCTKAITINKAPATISFEEENVTKNMVDEKFINKLIGVKDGTVSYESSNTNVAEINSQGEVTIKGLGTSDISATIKNSANYTYNTAIYHLIVEPVVITITPKTYTYDGKSHEAVSTSDNSNYELTYYKTECSSSNKVEGLPKNAGVYYVTGKIDNVNILSCTKAITINKANGSISFDEKNITKYLTDSFTKTPTKVGDGEITYSSSNVNVA